MMTSQMKIKELLECGGSAVNKVREFLKLRIQEETENLVNARVEAVPQLQGRIKAYRDFLQDLTPLKETKESKNPY
ncbi:hypothetical protein [Maridesulfovibrio sp.]|uniref:hypothetical protein n=1 Tax=Maridesulfovibrio sp. TaxID=2795000 RepID=UPI002AA96012|nr:hypothetical protein [Maridesulfovibrio sp.]